jgi:hypothetical protein
VNRLRLLVPPLAAFLAVLVVVQTTDLVACADEAETAGHPGEVHTNEIAGGDHPAPVLGGVSVPGGSPDDGHGHNEGASADCLCHLAFAPTAVVPEVGARPAPGLAPLAAPTETPPEVEPDVLDPVPLA